VITPQDWSATTSVCGRDFNLAHNLHQMLAFRPGNKFQELDHCYLAGGGTHPGADCHDLRVRADFGEPDLAKHKVPFTSRNPFVLGPGAHQGTYMTL